MELIIDFILVIIIGIIALAAALLIPSNAQIQKNETGKYKSSKFFVYAAGFCALFIGILLIYLFAVNEDYQNLINIPKFALFIIIGISLIAVNFKKSKLLEAYESGAEAVTVTSSIAVTQSVVQPQVLQAQVVQPVQPAQQMQPVQVQPQVQAVQPVQVQPQVVQPQLKAAAKPKIVVIKCPKCKGDMQIDTSNIGQKMKCPHCGVEGRIG